MDYDVLGSPFSVLRSERRTENGERCPIIEGLFPTTSAAAALRGKAAFSTSRAEAAALRQDLRTVRRADSAPRRATGNAAADVRSLSRGDREARGPRIAGQRNRAPRDP